MTQWKFGLAACIILIGLGGCESTISDNGSVSIKAGSAVDKAADKLGTLSTDQESIGKMLSLAPWKRIRANISAFYENQNFPQSAHTYRVDLRFGQKSVTAYADCKKITARYSLEGKKLRFSHVSTPAPAVDLATCVESEFADEAVLALFENSFMVTSVDAHKAVLDAEDFDTTVELER
jgi:hypothetical protein